MKHGEYLADLPAADANGFYVRDTVIPFDVGAGAGNFQRPDFPDDPFPGFPGSQTLNGGTGNATEEVFTYLQFPAAGVYVMGVNSDDGFRVCSTLNPRDKLGVVCGFFEGGRGASDTLLTLVSEQPAIYPFRLLGQNGDGGANVQWFTVQTDGTKALLNDSASGALKTWRARTFVPAPTIAIGRQAGNLVITFTGTLQAADDIIGPWTAVVGGSPSTAAPSGARKFDRARQ